MQIQQKQEKVEANKNKHREKVSMGQGNRKYTSVGPKYKRHSKTPKIMLQTKYQINPTNIS